MTEAMLDKIEDIALEMRVEPDGIKRLGHQQVSTTQNIYAHMVAKADAEASKAVTDVLFRKKA